VAITRVIALLAHLALFAILLQWLTRSITLVLQMQEDSVLSLPQNPFHAQRERTETCPMPDRKRIASSATLVHIAPRKQLSQLHVPMEHTVPAEMRFLSFALQLNTVQRNAW